MNNQRQLDKARGADMAAEAFLLRFSRGGVVEIIEAGFADADHFRMRGGGDNCVGRNILAVFLHMMWVNAKTAKNIVQTFRRGENRVKIAPRRGDIDHAPDARARARAISPFAVFGKGGKIEVAMTVDKHNSQ